MSDVVSLAKRRPPIWFTIEIGWHWDDRLEVIVRDVADDARSRKSVDDAIARVAETRMQASHIHRAMLARIDALMDMAGRTAEESEELRALASACEAYERIAVALQ